MVRLDSPRKPYIVVGMALGVPPYGLALDVASPDAPQGCCILEIIRRHSPEIAAPTH
jgi:hypothetical protein